MRRQLYLLVVILATVSPAVSQTVPAETVDDTSVVVMKKLDPPASSYFSAGASLGTPAGFNLMTGYTYHRIFVRLSGMDYGRSLYGLQIDLGGVLKRTARTTLGIGLVGGTSRVKIENDYKYQSLRWTYAGVALSGNLGGFHGQLGLSWGNGYTYEYDGYEMKSADITSPQALLQLGYEYQFR
jgi:hypothetical protein